MRRKRNFITYLQWILMAVLLLGCAPNESDDFQEGELIDEQTEIEAVDEDQSEYIVVHVCGEVKMPGVYSLEADSRIYDAIMAAGGQTENAADAYLNLAQVLTDGLKIYVPSKEEIEQNEMNDTSFAVSDYSGSKISINKAGKEELMTLQGIGESKAEAIIAYRQANGGFQKLEDLMKVEGIKEGTFEKIKDLISL